MRSDNIAAHQFKNDNTYHIFDNKNNFAPNNNNNDEDNSNNISGNLNSNHDPTDDWSSDDNINWFTSSDDNSNNC